MSHVAVTRCDGCGTEQRHRADDDANPQRWRGWVRLHVEPFCPGSISSSRMLEVCGPECAVKAVAGAAREVWP